jgi:glucan phosphoethanolaminetransferase (alkaline phosphatase superfamily)
MFKSALIKLYLLLTFIIVTNPLSAQRIESIGWQRGLLVYLCVFFLAILAMVLLAYSRFSKTKVFLSILLVLASALSFGYFQATHLSMEIFELEILLNATENLLDAVFAFSGMLTVLLISIVGLVALLMPSNSHVIFFRSPFFNLFPCGLVVAVIISILVSREGEGTQAMPTQFTPIAYWLTLKSEELMLDDQVTSSELTLEPAIEADSGDLVFVMDESMSGDFYDINSSSGVPTSINKYQPINFGIASSFANCSAPSNRSMRYGVSRSSYLTDVIDKPSIWQFAKRAGYRTVYIDTQHGKGDFGNHMTKLEADFIDDFIQVLDKDVILYNKDLYAASLLHERLNNNKKEFIYINKTGAHFPFEGKYPKDEKRYHPSMPPSGFTRSFHEVDEVEYPVSGDALTRLKFVNSYRNAVSWNLTAFFSELYKNKIDQPYILIYTSDHGQTFHDDGRKGYGTHCSIKVTDPEEGRVPLVVFTNIKHQRIKLQQAAKMNVNKVSHFNLPATIYGLMGYQSMDLASYHEDLFAPLQKKDQRFLSKYYVRFGAEPIWNSIYKAVPETSQVDKSKMVYHHF